MRKPFVATGLVLSLAAAGGPLQAAEGRHRSWPMLEEVTASADADRVVKVGCEHAPWPTVRQVAARAGTSMEDATALRRHIVRRGRQACAAGATHVVVAFKADPAAMAHSR